MGIHTDEELVLELKHSNRQALKVLFDSYYDQLLNYLIYLVKDIRVAEDLLQDLFIRIWEYRANLDPDKPIAPYLYSVARSLAFNHQKKIRQEITFIIEKKSGANDESDSMQEVDESEMNTYLQKCINDLPANNRSVLLMNKMEGLTYEEIAAYLNLSVKAIEKRIQKAFELLRTCIEHHVQKNQ